MPNQTSLFSAIFEGAGIGMLLVDPSGRVLKTNRVLQEWIGYSADELQSMTFDQFTFPEDTTNDSDLFKELAQGKRTRYQVETRCVRKNGDAVWGRVTVSLVHPSKNDPILVFRIIEDITQRKQIELALAAQTNGLSYRAIFEQTDIGIMVVDREGRVLESNSALQTMMAYTGDELSQFTFGDVTHPDDLNDDREQFEDLVQNRRTYYQIEKRLRREDGSLIWVRTTVVRIQVNPDYPQFAVRIVENITIRKQVEEAFHRAHRAYRTLSQSNEILLHATNEIQLLQEVCQLIVESGAYLMTRVGFAAKDEQKSVFLAAHAGDEVGDLTGIAITWADTELGRGPTGTAIRTGQPSVVQHVLTDPAYEPWRADAIQRGYASSAALPLMAGYQAFGALTIYAPEPDAFSSDEIALLEELANNLAFGIITIRTRELHQRTKHALEASETRLRHTIETSIDAIISANSEGNIVGWNQAAETLFGYPIEQAIGQTLTMIMPERHRQTYQASMQQFLTTQQSSMVGTTVKVVGLHKDGSEFPIELSLTKGKTGGEMFFTAIIRDITERVQAEAALIASETRYRRLFEAAQDGILILDADTGKVVDVNPFLLDLLGYSQQEILGKELWEIGFFKDITASQAAFLELQDKGYIRYEDLPLEARDGRRIEVEFVSNAYLVNGKQVIQCNIRDITDRKQAEETVRFQAQLVNAIGQAVIATDAEGNVSFWNRFAETLYGWSAEEAIGRNIVDLTPADISRQQAAEIMTRLQSGETWRGEFTVQRKDGSTFPALVTDTPIVDEQGTQIGIISTSINITDRIQAEEKIRNLAKFPAENPSPVLRLGQDGLILFANQGSQPLLEDWGCATGEYAPEFWGAMVTETLASQEKQLVEIESGDHVWLFYVAPVSAEGYANLYGLDITARKQAEAALQESEARLRTVLENMPVMLDALDEDLNIIVWNRECERVTGYSADEIINHPRVSELLYPDPHYRERMQGKLALNDDYRGWEWETTCKDGSVRTIAWSNLSHQCPVPGWDQWAIGVDITELRQVERQLHKLNEELEQRVEERTAQLNHAKERIEAILNSSTDVMILCRTDGTIGQANPAFDQVFRYRSHEAFNQPLTMLFAPESVATMEQAFVAVIETRQPQRLEAIARYKDSPSFDADIVLSPVVGSDQQLLGVICSLRDITERKKMEAQLRKVLAHEMELSELKTRYVSMAAHDLRNPLAVILSAVDIIDQYSDRLTDEKKQVKFNDIRTNIKVMVDMLDDILTIGQVESGKLTFNPVRLDVVAFCQRIAAEMPHVSGAASRIVFSSQGDCSTAQLDAKLLRHILSNLLSNAVKYSPEHRPVLFTARCEPDQITFRVQDQGIGIPEEDQKRLFGSFHRASNVRQIPGTGLGLAIAKQSVAMHGGTITFESGEGVGTTFTVTLPAPRL
jgi:PAS domain S-box-containing protein